MSWNIHGRPEPTHLLNALTDLFCALVTICNAVPSNIELIVKSSRQLVLPSGQKQPHNKGAEGAVATIQTPKGIDLDSKGLWMKSNSPVSALATDVIVERPHSADLAFNNNMLYS